MWTPPVIAAVAGAAVAIIGAVFTGLAQLRHAQAPEHVAHPPASPPPPGP